MCIRNLLLVISLSCFIFEKSFCQNVAINNTNANPHASAILDMSSQSKGVLIPRMTTAECESIPSPATGLLVYDTSKKSFMFFDGVSWKAIFSNTNNEGWKTSGNDNINNNHFIGTTNSSSLHFRVNNIPSGEIDGPLHSLYLGSSAGMNNTGYRITALGFHTLTSNTTGNNNTGVGSWALEDNTTGEDNVAVGSNALKNNTIGISNTAVGNDAMLSNTTGQINTAIGNEAMLSNTSGNGNTAIGTGALYTNTVGGNNLGAGSNALRNNVSGSFNLALGTSAMYLNTTGQNNIAIGTSSLNNNNSGSNNIAIGRQALYSNTGYNNNIAIGDSALRVNGFYYDPNDQPVYNIAIGSQALMNNTIGYSNTAIGHKVLNANTFASENTGIGFKALLNNTGAKNTAVGTKAMIYNQSGIENTALGQIALSQNTTGSSNSAIGHSSLASNITGTKNTALGYRSDVLNSNQTYSTAIGADAQVNCSNCLTLGGTGSASTYVGINQASPNADLHIKQKNSLGNTRGLKMVKSNSNVYWRMYVDDLEYLHFEYWDWGPSNSAYITTTGQVVSSSDATLKKDVRTLDGTLEKVKHLRPVSYHLTNQDSTDRLNYGFIAQELETEYPDIVFQKEEGTKGVAYQELIAIAIQAIKEQQVLIENLQAEVTALKAKQ